MPGTLPILSKEKKNGGKIKALTLISYTFHNYPFNVICLPLASRPHTAIPVAERCVPLGTAVCARDVPSSENIATAQRQLEKIDHKP